MRTRAQTRRLSMFPNEDIKVAVLQFLDLEDLKQLSLCNKEWRRRVVPAIFIDATLREPADEGSTSEPASSNFSSLKEHNLLRHAKHLHIVVEKEEPAISAVDTLISNQNTLDSIQSHFQDGLLAVCPRLQKLSLDTTVSTPSFVRQVMGVIISGPDSNASLLSKIECLVCLRAGSDVGQRQLDLGTALSGWAAHIKALDLVNFRIVDDSLAPLRHSIGLTDLTLSALTLNMGVEDLVAHCLQGQQAQLIASLPMLRNLRCISQRGSTTSLSATIAAHLRMVTCLDTPQLTSLTYVLGDGESGEYAEGTEQRIRDLLGLLGEIMPIIPGNCPNLREVRFFALTFEIDHGSKPARVKVWEEGRD